MDNLRGILLMVAAMAAFAVEDMFIKFVARALPPGQIILILGLFGAAVFAVLARAQGNAVWSRDAAHPAVIGRNLFEVVGTLGFVTAIALTPLTSASAIVQATPLAVTLGAALFLRDSVGWRRGLAIFVGFLGVLVVIRPGMDGFRPASLWAVLAVVGMTGRDLCVRRVPARITTMQLSCWGFATGIPLGLAMLAVTGGAARPDLGVGTMMAGALVCSVVGYWAVVAATRTGEIAAVIPFRYTRLLFALVIGVTVFDERPDLWTLVGSALVIGSGLYTFARERALRRRTLPMQGLAG